MKTKILPLMILIFICSNVAYSQNISNEILGAEEESREFISGKTGFNSKETKSVIYSEIGNPPNWGWAKKHGGSYGIHSMDLLADHESNKYLTGYFQGKIKFDEQSTYESGIIFDLFIFKLNKNNKLSWFIKPDSPPQGFVNGTVIEKDQKGYIYVAGNLGSQELTIQGHTITQIGNQDIFLLKMDTLGNLIWLTNFGNEGNSYNSTNGAIAIDKNEGVYVTTEHTLLKFDGNGNFLWEKECGNLKDLKHYSNYIYIAGDGQGTYLNNQINGLYTAKLNLDGDVIWLKEGEAANYESSDYKESSLTVDENENVYFAGYKHEEWVHFLDEDNDFTMNDKGHFIIKYNHNGNLIWSKEIPGLISYPSSPSIMINESWELILFGRYNNTFSYDGIDFTSDGEKSYILKIDTLANGIEGATLPQNLSAPCHCKNDTIFCLGLMESFDCIQGYNTSGEHIDEYLISTDEGTSTIWYLIDTDENGNIYTHGMINGHMDLETTSLEGNGSYIAKFNKKGSCMWAKLLKGGTKPSGISVSKKGQLIAWGSYWTDSLTFDANTIKNSKAYNDYIVSFDTAGNFKWLKQLESTDYSVGTGGITHDMNENFYILTHFVDSINAGTQWYKNHGTYGHDFLLVKFNSSGNVEWSNHYGSEGYDYGRSIDSDNNNNIYITGGFTDSIAFDEYEFTSTSNGYNYFITKFNKEGKVLWAQIANHQSDNNSRGHSLVSDKNGHLYTSGYFNRYVGFGSEELSSNSYYSNFLTKYDTSGNVLWTHAINNTGNYSFPFYKIDADNEGNCYMGSNANDSVIFDTGEILPGRGYGNYLAKYNKDGDLEWAVSNSNLSSVDKLFTISAYHEDKITIGGRISLWMKFDDIVIETKSTNSILAWIGKTLSCTPYHKTIDTSMCPGDSILWRDEYYKNEGSYYDSLLTVEGCDSIYELNLELNNVYLITEDTSLCEGDIYTWHGRELKQSGTYFDSLLTIHGCDSIHKINITLYELPYVELGENQTLSADESITLEPDEFISYLWHDNSTNRSFIVNGEDYDPGEYIFWVQVTDEHNCQNADTITIIVEEAEATGIPSASSNGKILFYPNPTKEYLNIGFQDINSEQLIINITSMDGKSIYYNKIDNVFTNYNEVINISKYPKGIYIIHITSEKISKTVRFIIK